MATTLDKVKSKFTHHRGAYVSTCARYWLEMRHRLEQRRRMLGGGSFGGSELLISQTLHYMFDQQCEIPDLLSFSPKTVTLHGIVLTQNCSELIMHYIVKYILMLPASPGRSLGHISIYMLVVCLAFSLARTALKIIHM